MSRCGLVACLVVGRVRVGRLIVGLSVVGQLVVGWLVCLLVVDYSLLVEVCLIGSVTDSFINYFTDSFFQSID